MKKYIQIFQFFVLAFTLNVIYEFLHSLLYSQYQMGAITSFILIRAAFWDAVLITTLFLASFLFFKKENSRLFFIMTASLCLAILIEKWALATNRWNYNSLMPIIAFLHIGLTPTIQLAITALISFWILEKKNYKKILENKKGS